MMAPVSASSPALASAGDPQRKVDDVFSLLGIIRRKESWVRDQGSTLSADLETVHQPDGTRFAEVSQAIDVETAATSAPSIRYRVDPASVRHVRRIMSAPDQANLTMVMDGDEEEVTLMFTRSVRGRDSRAPVLAARLFQHWLTSCNDAIMLMTKVDSHSYLLKG
jgi:hypothetical protein